MRRTVWRVVSVLLIVVLTAPGMAFAAPAGSSRATVSSAAAPPPPLAVGALSDAESTTDVALQRIDPELRPTARAGGAELVKVTVLVAPGADADAYAGRYFERAIVVPGREFDRVVGVLPAGRLVKLATTAGTLAVLNMEARPAPKPPVPTALLDAGVSPERRTLLLAEAMPKARPREVASVATEPLDVVGVQSYFSQDTNGVEATWALGVTGAGDTVNDPLKLAVIDTGVDFANPDLYGIQARVTDPDSAYFDAGSGTGWPIAFDDRSMSDYALDVQDYRGNWGWYMNAFKVIQDPDLASTAPFTFTVTHPDLGEVVTYTIDSLVQSYNENGGRYRFGWHPDDALVAQLGEAPGVLVTGEQPGGSTWGDFDTIYVDLYPDYAFDAGPADGWAALGQEIACINLGWSSPASCDLSGGMVTYIANGTTPIPASDWLYGLPAVSEAGSVVAFMLNDILEDGADHGTLCAGTAVGQGNIVEMPYSGTYGSVNWPPAWYNPLADGGISQGPGKDTKLVAMGNYYAGGASLNFYDFAALGYDGVPAGHPDDTADQPHITTNSYGSGAIENDGWDLSSRYVTLINKGYVAQQGITLPDGGNRSPLFVGSTGNSGFGYGTVTSPQPETAVMVGVSTVFGQYNLGDTALDPEWVNWGQLGGFSDRGPTSMATLGVHVLANGFFGSGNIPLNWLTGGDWAVDYWSGTSRSGPEVGGILALIYDAFYQEKGRYPAWHEARTLLMNGARTLYSDPMAQGAGMANALNAVEIIRGDRGVMIANEDGDPYWVPGDYRGDEFYGFARGLFAGETATETFTVDNNGLVATQIDLDAVELTLIDHREWNFTSLPLAQELVSNDTPYYGRRLFGAPGSPGSFGGADPLYLTTNPTDAQLIADADLLVVRMSYPYEQFLDDIEGNWWFLYAFAWRDDNTDDLWYTDANANGVANTGESQAERVRISYDYHGNTAEIRIRSPQALLDGDTWPNEPTAAPMSDILIMLRHFYSGAFDTTDLSVTVELYQEVPWPAVTLDRSQLTIPAEASRTFVAETTATEPPGSYGGYIKASYSTPYEYWEYLPVQKQVWFASDVDPLLGGVDQPTLYDNGVVYGARGPSSAGDRAESGDWRFFYTDVGDGTLPADLGTYLLAQTTWEGEDDAPNDTDLDTLFYAPTVADPLFTGQDSLFGPSGLTVVGGSPRVGSAPDWAYQTSTNGPEDWSAARMTSPGLHAVAAQVVRWGGERTAVPFTITVGTAQATASVHIAGRACLTCAVPLTFKTNHTSLEGAALEAIGYGFSLPLTRRLAVPQGDTATVTYTITASDALRLLVTTSNPDAGVDADLTVYRRVGAQWVEVGYSGRADSNERVLLYNPVAGDYLIEVYGYAIPGGTADVDVAVTEVSGAGAMTVTGLPTSIVLGQTYDLTLHFTTTPPFGTWYGMVLMGPAESPTAIEIPVTIEPVRAYLPVIFKN